MQKLSVVTEMISWVAGLLCKKKDATSHIMVVSFFEGCLSYVICKSLPTGNRAIVKSGQVIQGEQSLEEFAHQLQVLGLKGQKAIAMLQPEQYQLLKIDAPIVQPEELKYAVRYKVRDLIEAHIDDVTLDVLKVGDGRESGAGQVFVVAAKNSIIRGILDLSDLMGWSISVMDIQEIAQRNLVTAIQARDQYVTKDAGASASLVIIHGRQAVFTVTANGELFYTRSLDVPAEFWTDAWIDQSGNVDLPSTFGSSNTFLSVIGDGGLIEEYIPSGAEFDSHDYSLDFNRPASDNRHRDGLSMQRFLIELQRSIDAWSRIWTRIPLEEIHVYAENRSQDMARWIAKNTFLRASEFDLGYLFDGDLGWLKVPAPNGEKAFACMPLLGIILRTEDISA